MEPCLLEAGSNGGAAKGGPLDLFFSLLPNGREARQGRPAANSGTGMPVVSPALLHQLGAERLPTLPCAGPSVLPLQQQRELAEMAVRSTQALGFTLVRASEQALPPHPAGRWWRKLSCSTALLKG